MFVLDHMGRSAASGRMWLQGCQYMQCLYVAIIFVEQVIPFVCDGAKHNRRFFRGMGLKNERKEEVVYKTKKLLQP